MAWTEAGGRGWRRLPGPAARALLVGLMLAGGLPGQTPGRPPNVIVILADDLGYGELGCYGQERIRTPNLDRMAREGRRFTRFYAGAPVCAPSRCVLLTGRALGHAAIRDNREIQPEGQAPLPAAEVTIAEVLRARGYATGFVGKWGLGLPGTSGDPNDQGFDLFHGYICQRVAHGYFPTHLWLNGERQLLDNPVIRPHQKVAEGSVDPARYRGGQDASALMASSARAFVRGNRERPFLLVYAPLEPHLALQPPPEIVATYPREWDREPYRGTKGYLPHDHPRAAYAALITRLDADVGRLLDLVDELGLGSETLVLFTSDNGPTHDVGGVDTSFFDSSGGLRGRKGSVYEGGLRVPLIARWPGRIDAGTLSDHVGAFQDILPTLAAVAGAASPAGLDGLAFEGALLGRADQAAHEQLVWEFPGYGGQQAIIRGRWKAVRRGLQKDPGAVELYDLQADPTESRDLAGEQPGLVAELLGILAADRRPSSLFPIGGLDR